MDLFDIELNDAAMQAAEALLHASEEVTQVIGETKPLSAERGDLFRARSRIDLMSSLLVGLPTKARADALATLDDLAMQLREARRLCETVAEVEDSLLYGAYIDAAKFIDTAEEKILFIRAKLEALRS